MRAPCQGCEKRAVGCRKDCGPWIAYQEQQTEIRRKKELEWMGKVDCSEWGTKKQRARISARKARWRNGKG